MFKTIILSVLLMPLACVIVSPSYDQPESFNAASPQLRQFLKQHPKAWQTLTNVLYEAFPSGRGFELYYYYSDDPSEPGAMHEYRSKTIVGIYIQQNQQPSDEFLSLVYEAFNSMNQKQFLDIYAKARKGVLSKSGFVREILQLEFEAEKKTRDVLKQIQLSKRDMSKSISYKHLVHLPDDFEKFYEELKAAGAQQPGAIQNYEKQYDWLQTNDPYDTPNGIGPKF